MSDAIDVGARRHGALLLADISGYTGFLQGVADAHHAIVVVAAEPPPAYAVLSSLLDTIVARLEPSFQLVKFEGDAVFAVSGHETIHGPPVIACLRACHAAFAAKLEEARSQWSCTCDACARIGDLDLKFVLHHGEYVAQRIAGREELLGSDVNVVHRLLKNRVRELIGDRPYALVTDPAMRALDVPADEMVAVEESYEDMAPIAAHVLVLA